MTWPDAGAADRRGDQFRVRPADGTPVRVRPADGTPVRVRVQSGAGELALDGTTHRGIAPGRSFAAYGWGTGATGIDLSAVAGMSALRVTAS